MVAKYRLSLKCGGHVEVDEQGERHNIKAGETFESHRDLIALFCKGNAKRCKFELLSPLPLETPQRKPNIPSPQADFDKGEGEGDTDTSSPNPAHPKFGEDITSEFPLAVDLSVKVFEKKYWCLVVDVEEGDEVLNEKKLRRKNVNAFLETIEVEDEEEDPEDEDE